MTDRPATVADPYAHIAALYDVEHDDVIDDAELYAAIAEQVGGPVLELGCGSGRLLAYLAAADRQVTGIDRSPVMLARARARLEQANLASAVTLFEGEMEEAARAPGAPFGLVLFSLNALMHLDSPERQLDALKAARAAMRQGARVVVDVLNPTPQYLVDLGRGPILEWSADLDDGSSVDKWSVRVIDAVEQVIDTTLWYDQVSMGGAIKRHRTRFTLRYLHANELLLMLELAGFTDVSMFGSTDLEPLTEASERIIVIGAAA